MIIDPEFTEELAHWSKAAHAARYKITALARIAGLSGKQLRRHFRTRYNRSPKEFLDHDRATRAAQAMREGMSPKEAAANFFYSDTAHLHHALKRHIGTTPSQIIAQRSEDPAAANASQLVRRLIAGGVFIQQKVHFLQGAGLGDPK